MPDDEYDDLIRGVVKRTPARRYDVDTALDLIAHHESGGRNIKQQIVPEGGGYNPSVGKVTGPSSAEGPWQILHSTWRKRAPREVLQKYPTPMSAPIDVQRSVAGKMYRETGFQDWAPYNASLRRAIARGEQPQQPAADEYSKLISEVLGSEQSAAPPVAPTQPRRVRTAPPVRRAQPQHDPTADLLAAVSQAGGAVTSQVLDRKRPKITSRADIMRAEEQPQASRGTYNNIDPRILKGEQPSDPMAYAKAQELVGRTEPQREVGGIRAGATAMGPRDRGVMERISDVVDPYLRLDRPAGIKTDPIRGAASLGLLDLRREITPEEKLIDPQAEAKAELAYQVGSFAPAVVPYVAAGKVISKIPALNAATREAHIARTALTFGGVELGRELARSAQTGEPLNPQEVAISTAIGGGIGGLAGVNPSLKRQIVAFITPQVVVDVARGTDPVTATQSAFTNLLFALHSGTAPRELQPVKRVLESRVRGEGREATTTIPEIEAVGRRVPEAVEVPTRAGDAVRLREQEAPQPTVGRAVVPEPTRSVTNAPPTQVAPQPPVEARVAVAEPADAVQGRSVARPVGDSVVETLPATETPRHVDLQPRRAKNTASGTKGQFKRESAAQREERRQQVNPPEPLPSVAGEGRAELLERMDAALARMNKDEHYDRLLAKRNAIAAGADYSVKDVTAELIGGTAAQIGKLTKATGLRQSAVRPTPSTPSPPPEAAAPPVAVTPTAKAAEGGQKQAWEITLSERLQKAEASLGSKRGDAEWRRQFLDNQKLAHRNQVQRALREGKLVPEAVLRDYPDLIASRQGGPTEPAAPRPTAVNAAQRPVQEAAPPVKATASPAPWRQTDAKAIIAELPLKESGYNAELVGGVKKKGQSEHDIDILLTPTHENFNADAIWDWAVKKGYDPMWTHNMETLEVRTPDKRVIDFHFGDDPTLTKGQISEVPTPLSGTAAPRAPSAKAVSGDAVRVPPLKVAEPATKPPPAQPAKAAERPPSTTSAKKAQMSGDREALDLPELPAAQRKSWRESLSQAKPESANRLADEVLANPRGLNDAETASVVVRAQQVKNEHAAKMAEIAAATDAETITKLRGETAALESEFDKLTQATKASGTEKGRTLAAQKLTINQDFDLVSMVARAKAAKGRDITADERARYEHQSKRIAELEGKLVEANNRAQTAQLQRQIDRVKRQTKRGETKAVLDEEFAALKQQFATAKIETRSGVQSSGLAALDPEGKLTVLIAKMARNRVKAGVVEAEKLVDEVYGAISEHINVTKRDVRDAISGYGIEPRGDRQSGAAKQLAQIRSELRRLSVQEDVAAGKRLPRQDKVRQTQLLKQEADLSRRLEQRDFSRVERQPVQYTRETYALQKRVDELKAQFQRELYRAEQGVRGRIHDTAVGAVNIPKTMLSMADLSAVLRQGGVGVYQHPILSGKAGADMIRSFSERGFANVEAAIKAHRDFELARTSGVQFTGVDKADPKLSHREEGYFGSDVIDTLSRGRYNPLRVTIKPIKDFSERTFVSFLDSQRMRIFAHQAEQLRAMKLPPKDLQAALKSQARYINIITGRGSLGRKGNQAAPLLNMAMFSPRLVASRFQLLNKIANPASYAMTPKGARKLQMIDNIKFAGGVAATLALARAAGADVNLDPDDSDFLKIKIGDARYDTLAGLQQPLRFLWRMTKAATSDSDTYAGADKSDIALDFARSKSAPAAGLGWDWLEGKNRLTGKKFEAGKDALRTAIPLPLQDFREAIKQDGAVKGIVESLPTLLGVGVQTYPMSPEKPQTHAEKLARRIIRDNMPESARTEEEIEASRKASDLRARSRRGEDVSAQLPPLNLTERQAKSIIEAKGVPRFNEDFKRLGLEDALRVWSVASATERAAVKPILAAKADGVDQLDESKQAAVKAQLRAIGIVPVEELPADKRRDIISKRRLESREQSRERREKQRGRQRPSLGYGYN